MALWLVLLAAPLVGGAVAVEAGGMDEPVASILVGALAVAWLGATVVVAVVLWRPLRRHGLFPAAVVAGAGVVAYGLVFGPLVWLVSYLALGGEVAI